MLDELQMQFAAAEREEEEEEREEREDTRECFVLACALLYVLISMRPQRRRPSDISSCING